MKVPAAIALKLPSKRSDALASSISPVAVPRTIPIGVMTEKSHSVCHSFRLPAE